MYKDGVSAFPDEDYLALSGIQHFVFCPRQWALIHIECQWEDNQRTAEGELQHERAHDTSFFEKRGDRLIVRAMPVASATLGIRGACDIVEFNRSENGVCLSGRKGKWQPCPIEYKHGDGSASHADSLQLCAQAMCLEEMLCCQITEGYLYYAAVRRRERVELSGELREEVQANIKEMHRLYERGYTPRVRKRPGCRSCSLKEICLPVLEKSRSASAYMDSVLEAQEERGQMP